MPKLKKEQIKRKFSRFKVKDHTFVILSFAVPFHILDISVDGLSFRYLGKEKWFDNPKHIDITYKNIHIKKVPVQSVSDSQLNKDLMPTRRHSLKFSNNSSPELRNLVDFIEQSSDYEI